MKATYDVFEEEMNTPSTPMSKYQIASWSMMILSLLFAVINFETEIIDSTQLVIAIALLAYGISYLLYRVESTSPDYLHYFDWITNSSGLSYISKMSESEIIEHLHRERELEYRNGRMSLYNEILIWIGLGVIGFPLTATYLIVQEQVKYWPHFIIGVALWAGFVYTLVKAQEFSDQIVEKRLERLEDELEAKTGSRYKQPESQMEDTNDQ